ncbi:MAG: GBS Bsp-like repeat-containing protein [Lachnospiraceae bacterium]
MRKRKKLKKKMCAMILVCSVLCTLFAFTPSISVRAEGDSPTNRDIVASALTHLGAGYSQASSARYGTAQYDCSGFVQQMLRSVGFQGYIPSTTADWRRKLSGMQVGSTFQLACVRNGVSTVQTFEIVAVGDSCTGVNVTSYPEGTIVLQNGHIFISLGDLSRYMTGDTAETEENVRQYLMQRYPEVDASLFYGTNPYFGNPNVYCQSNESVWKIDAGTYTGVCVRNRTIVADGTQTVAYAFRLVDGCNISYADAQVTETTEYGYTITAQVGFAYHLTRAVAYTWTEAGGPNDYVCQEVVLDGSNQITYRFNISDLRNQHGVYYTNLYIYDENGTRARTKQMVYVPYPEPTIQNAWISDVDVTGYTVHVEFDNPDSVESVQMPTWSSYQGQDDIVWHEAVIEGNTAAYRVNILNHKNEGGEYNTHIYVNCMDGTSYTYALSVEVPNSIVQNTNNLRLQKINLELDKQILQAAAFHQATACSFFMHSYRSISYIFFQNHMDKDHFFQS